MREGLIMPLQKNPFPGIPAITNDKDVVAALRVVIEIVELLTGQRGSDPARQAALQSYVASNLAAMDKRLKALEP